MPISSEECRINARYHSNRWMDDLPSITVVLACYNKSHIISKSLDLLKKSFIISHKIIVIEDKSTDSSLSILKQEKNIELIVNNINKGWGASNNIALERVETAYVVFLDADFLIGTYGWLETWLSLYKKNYELGESGELHYCPTLLDIEKGKFYKKLSWVSEGKSKIAKKLLMNDTSKETLEHIGGNYKIFQKSILWSIGGFSEVKQAYLMETEISFRIKHNGLKIVPYRVPYSWTMLRHENEKICDKYYKDMLKLLEVQKKSYEEYGALSWFPTNILGNEIFYRS